MALNPGQQANARFYELLWPYRADVLRMARILCENDSDADAEDLAQETLLDAFSAIDGLEDGASARAWLVRILRNAQIDRVRGSTQELSDESRGVEVSVHQESAQSLEDWKQPGEIFDAFTNHQMIQVLQALPMELRFALMLVDIQQMDDKDAAEILATSIETIKRHAHQGRAMLRQVLLSKARKMKRAKAH